MTNEASAHPSGNAHGAFTGAGVWRGFVAVQPLAVGVFVYGVTVGLLAVGSGLSSIQAALLSLGVNSGSAQTLAANAVSSGAGLSATALSVMLLNSRYVFYGAALRPWLEKTTGVRAYVTLFFLGDGNWLLSMRARSAGEDDAGFVLGSGMAMYLAWLSGTVLAVALGSTLPTPEAFGLDFLLVAFCTAMVAEGIFERPEAANLAIGFVSIVAALMVDRLVSPTWAVLAAGAAGVGAAYLYGSADEEQST